MTANSFIGEPKNDCITFFDLSTVNDNSLAQQYYGTFNGVLNDFEKKRSVWPEKSSNSINKKKSTQKSGL